jgi:hypothetical protein
MTRMATTRRSLAAGLVGLATLAASRAARAHGLPDPSGKPILTVSGRIGVFNDDHMAKFDRAMLEAMGSTKFTTTTPWYDEPVTFEGVLMARLMQVIGATGNTVIATALNDYETKIPLSDLTEFKVLLALKRNGEYMPVRDKGPLFIVYPFDSDPALKNQKYYGRSAWQLAALVIA